MKRLICLVLAAGLLAMLGGCYYPAYQRPGVVYDGDSSAAYYDDDGGYYSPGYYPGYAYYDPWYYGYGAPWLGLGFYGGYYCCGHHGFHGHDGWHGGHGNGGGHGNWHGGGSGGHHGH